MHPCHLRVLASLVLLLVLLLVLAACGGGGGGGANTAPTVVVTAPDVDVEMGLTQGGVVTITYRDADPDDEASTDLVADLDGNPGTTGDQIPIASGRPDRNGVEQTVSWNTAGVPAGSYTILAKTSDAATAVVGTAPGRVLLNAPSTLSITEPAQDITVSRGGMFTVAYADSDPDDVALTWLSADRDGDPATTQPGDVTTAPRIEADGRAQELTMSLGAAAVDSTFSILGTTWDGTNLPATATAPGRVTVRNVAWVKGFGNTGSDRSEARGVGALPDGSCIIGGDFRGSLTFGAGEPGEETLDAAKTDIFVARYDPDGTLAWVKQAGGAENDTALSFGVFPDGSSVVTGGFQDSATFGAGETNETTITTGSQPQLYVARYNANGTLAWVRSVGGTGAAIGEGVATHADGSFVLSGRMVAEVVFGPGEANQTALTSSGSNVFVARYNANGTLAWASFADGGGFSAPGAVAVFPDGACVVSGSIGGFAPLTFGAGEPSETTITPGVQDPFVARWNADGTFAWVVHIAPAGGGSAYGVTGLADGSCIVQGTVVDAVVFGSGEVNETSFGAGTGAFLARYRSDGALLWAKRVEPDPATVVATSSDGHRVAARPDGSFVATGVFGGLCTFGAGEAGETTLRGTDSDGYLALYAADGSLLRVRALGGQLSPGGLAVRADGSFFLATGFRGTIVLGAGDPRETTLTTAPTTFDHGFVARFNADGGF